MSQDSNAPKKSVPDRSPPTEPKTGGGWRDPARRRSFNLGASGGKTPKSLPVKP